MNPELFGEFMGTLVLIFLGNSVVANVVLNKSKGQNSGWVVICMGFWLAVMAGVFTAIACGSPGAHINPAVTLALAVAGKTSFANFVPYFAAQLGGAFVGAILVWLQFLPHWAVTPDQGGKLACFSTGPAIPNMMTNLISEILGTAMLVFLIACVVSSKVSAGIAPGLAPLLIGAIVAAIGFGMGGPTGFAINPARDLGPRLAHAILPIAGKGSSDWGYAMVPVAGGLAGAVLAGLLISATGI
jgi:glycerol uptake facilitator protein